MKINTRYPSKRLMVRCRYQLVCRRVTARGCPWRSTTAIGVASWRGTGGAVAPARPATDAVTTRGRIQIANGAARSHVPHAATTANATLNVPHSFFKPILGNSNSYWCSSNRWTKSKSRNKSTTSTQLKRSSSTCPTPSKSRSDSQTTKWATYSLNPCCLDQNSAGWGGETNEAEALLGRFQKQPFRATVPPRFHLNRPDSHLPSWQEREDCADLPIQDQIYNHDEGVRHPNGDDWPLHWFEKR